MKQDADCEQKESRGGLWLVSLASASALGYAVLLWVSWQFAAGVANKEKPTIWMLVLFAGLFVAYWTALWLAVRMPSTRRLLVGIFAAACLFRSIMLPSIPMHEIDIYRYIWDGGVMAEGVSPYRYSPKQVQEAFHTGDSTDETLQQLVELLATSESLSYSLHQIHYGQYPSPYPMVSQAVFAFAAQITPDRASRYTRLVVMKLLLVLFDLATLVVVMWLLRDVGMHMGWSLAYGWCPLLMKEVANSGHLDSIAIFFTTLAIWLLVKATQATSLRWRHVALTGLALALAIGAKLYPVVLLPLFGAVWLRRHGWKTLTFGLAITGLLSACLLYPLFGQSKSDTPAEQEQQASAQPKVAGQLNSPPLSPQPTFDPDEGIQAFLKHWEMNDLMFMFVLENLRQQGEIAPAQKPWFVLTSDDWSRAVVTWWVRSKQSWGGAEPPTDPNVPFTTAELKSASFPLARVITGGVFALVACLLAWFAAGKNNPQTWCRAAMLILAWFWLTCPTQNPWYWCWALPFLPFARYRAWYVVAAMTMLYYLRFWLTAHYPEPPVLGTPYGGSYFFYFVIAWIEFVPVLLALVIEWGLSKKRNAEL